MPEPSYERGPYAKGRERRHAILAATLDLFSQEGYRKTSLRAIAREVGISPTLIQHYFSTREELLTEVITAWDRENGRLNAGLPMMDGFVQGIRHNTTIPGLVRLYTAYSVEAADPDHPARSYFLDRYRQLTEDIAEDIRSRKLVGCAPKEIDELTVARQLIAACEGLQIRWLHEPDFDMAAEFEDLLGKLEITLGAEAREKLAAAGVPLPVSG
jgi:AcrR family transcriptional regulator